MVRYPTSLRPCGRAVTTSRLIVGDACISSLLWRLAVLRRTMAACNTKGSRPGSRRASRCSWWNAGEPIMSKCGSASRFARRPGIWHKVRMALEDLREQRLTIGDNTLGRLAGAHLVSEGKRRCSSKYHLRRSSSTSLNGSVMVIGWGAPWSKLNVAFGWSVKRPVSQDRNQAHRFLSFDHQQLPGAC